MSGASVAVVGVGDVGSAVAEHLSAAGREVVLVSRRDADQLAEAGLGGLVGRQGVRVTPAWKSEDGVGVALVSVPYGRAASVLETVGDLEGVVVIDATNYNRGRDGDDADPGPGGSTPVLARRFPKARWVKAFNMLWAGYLRADARPGAPQRVVLVSGDDPGAKQQVADLVWQAGFVPFDTGTLEESATRQLQGTPAWNRQMDVAQATDLLSGSPGPMPRSAATR